jgi:hypothetical protein
MQKPNRTLMLHNGILRSQVPVCPVAAGQGSGRCGQLPHVSGRFLPKKKAPGAQERALPGKKEQSLRESQKDLTLDKE